MKSVFSLLVVLIVLAGCSKEEITPRQYSRLRTYAPTDLKASGVTLNAEVLYNNNLTDHGFIWVEYDLGFPSFSDVDAKSVSLGKMSGTGKFTKAIGGLKTKKRYTARSYARSNGILVYGDEVDFTPK